jgi:hypothetical protein
VIASIAASTPPSCRTSVPCGLIRAVFPDLEIHGSTQMTVHDPSGARVLQDMGVERVVLARENTLADLRAIREAVPGLGLETFIHGALCIAYSGQCYMSGMISERSANRGACAQSCRKDYVLADAATGAELDRGYLISAKDLAAAEHLDAIAEIGIGCLKIEGRKKKPEYVATVTRTYRTFLDRLANGEWAPPTAEETQPLVQIFSRGFTAGMFGGREGKDYITRAQPDNRGEELGHVLGSEGQELLVAVSHPIGTGDGLGFEHPAGASQGNSGFAVSRVRDVRRQKDRLVQAIALPPGAHVPAGWVVVRSSHAALLERARASYAAVERQGPVPRTQLDCVVTGREGAPLRLTCTADGESAALESSIPLSAAEKTRARRRQAARAAWPAGRDALHARRARDIGPGRGIVPAGERAERPAPACRRRADAAPGLGPHGRAGPPRRGDRNRGDARLAARRAGRFDAVGSPRRRGLHARCRTGGRRRGGRRGGARLVPAPSDTTRRAREGARRTARGTQRDAAPSQRRPSCGPKSAGRRTSGLPSACRHSAVTWDSWPNSRARVATWWRTMRSTASTSTPRRNSSVWVCGASCRPSSSPSTSWRSSPRPGRAPVSRCSRTAGPKA